MPMNITIVNIQRGGMETQTFVATEYGERRYEMLYHIFCETGLPVIMLLFAGVIAGLLMMEDRK